MKKILEQLYQYKTLTGDEAREVLINISSGKYNNSQIASFITAFMMRNVTIQELRGFREALLELCVPIDLSAYDPMDLCGTGGDGKNTFNISTLASFVVAGAGVPVAKHGNYGVSSVSGSSNVLEALGVKFCNDEGGLKRQLDRANICFLHAPLFHPALKNVGPIRKELGVKTFFNMLGPLVNPAKPRKQMTGVFNLELARMYHYLFQDEQVRFSIVHGLDGFDEISLTDRAKVITNHGEDVMSPEDFGFEKVAYEDLNGGDTVEQAASIFSKIIEGKGTDVQNKVVVANAALAISTYHGIPIHEGVQAAQDSLFNGKALNALNQLIAN
jgi:anthranilate phosphoribosyltransferase